MIRDNLAVIIANHNLASAMTTKFWQNIADFSQVDLMQKRIFYTGCLRQLGRQSLEMLSESELNVLRDLGINIQNINFGQLGRILYLLTYSEDSKFINEIIWRGDESEQVPLIQVLGNLPNCQKYCDNIINLCRSNSVTLYQAISQNNSYPNLYFDDNSFYHLAIKTIFLDLDFSKVVGLDERYNKIFGRILSDLYQERMAAGRTLPDNVIKFMKRKDLL